jgi:hypothetical protein
MNFQNKEKILKEQLKNYDNITNSLQIPENINQFGQPGYYPLCLLRELVNNYCIYCGDLFCPCELYINDNGKRNYLNNNDNDYGNNGDGPLNKKPKI